MYVIIVATAAPSIPYLGTRRKLSKILTPKANKESIRIILDFPIIEIKLLEISEIDAIKRPIPRNLKEFIATKYSGGNNKFIKTPGKSIIIKKSGRFNMKIHLLTCLLNCSIKEIFFLENSLVIRGKNI